VVGVGRLITTISRGALTTVDYAQDLVPDDHDFIVWTHVDPGSNVHIVMDPKLLHNFRKTKNKLLGQVSGDKKAVLGIGEWHISIAGHAVVLHNVLCMPGNPTCTLSTGALKLLDGFIYSAHDALAQLHLVCPIGIDEKYTTDNKTMRSINGLDYIPLITLLPQREDNDDDDEYAQYEGPPHPNDDPDGDGYISANAASVHLPRRSTRTKRLPLKFTDHTMGIPTPPQRVPRKNTPPSIIQINKHQNMPTSHNSSIDSPPLNSPLSKLPTTTRVPISSKTPSTPVPDTSSTPCLSSPQEFPSHPSHSTSDITNVNSDHSSSVHINSVLAHLRFGCRNMRNILHMRNNKSLLHLPSNIKELPSQCPICLKCKLTRLPRNPPIPITTLRPGQMLQLDFAFMNEKSVRGFTSYLSCDCVHTKYSFRFCTRHKRAPLDILRWIFLTLKQQKKDVNYVRFDEGGELARSYEINKMLVEEFQIVMQTTGGYSSHLNGVTERGHRTDADSIRTSLYAAGLSHEYWCFALLHSNYINRRWCRYPNTITPYEQWTKTKPSFNKLHIFGSTIYVHASQAKKLDPKAVTGIFLGYGSSTAVIYYLDAHHRTIKRAHHAKIDSTQLGASDDTPGSKMIQKYHKHRILNLPPLSLTLSTIASPFSYQNLFSYTVSIPPKGPLGLNLEDDKVFGLPIINTMTSDSAFRVGCKKSLHKNSWLVGIHHEEPITVNRFLEYVEFLRTNKIFNVQLTLTKRADPSATNYQVYRTYFDNFRPITSKATVILPESKYACQTPFKPPTPKTWNDVINGDFKDIWYKAVFERYDKNNNVGLLSIPIPATEVPPDTIILRAVSAFKIKKTSHANIYDFYFRMCADGSKQIKGLHFNESHSPTPAIWAILTCTCIASAFSLNAYTIDIDNAFQNTPRYPTKNMIPIFITCPPLYLHWFKSRFPNYKFNSTTKYVLQCFMNMQGLRTAGRDFHNLLKAILADLNIHPTSVDNGVFVFLYKNSLVLLAISTDDILIFTKYEEFYERIKSKLNTAFGVTSQKGNIIHYLNYQIVQSKEAISIDQSLFILDIVNYYIPPHVKCPKTDTPLRTDRQFDKEILDSTPATSKELKQLSIQYKGDYRTIFGQLCHIMKASRPDISNAINRLGVFQAAPNRLAYESIYRVLQYLKTHPNVPLVYPRQPFTSSTNLKVHSSTGSLVDSLKLPHCLCGHVDISFAPYKEFRHSVGGHVETLNGVAIDWRTMKQTSCATSATDAETRQYYDAAKRTLRIRNFLRQIGLTLPQASPVLPSFQLNYTLPSPIFEDNKGTRDMLAAGKVTSNLKHVDIPLTYLHSLHESSTITTLRAGSTTMVANFLTKQETGPQHIKSIKWISGRQYYPQRNSDHFQLLMKNHPLTLY